MPDLDTLLDGCRKGDDLAWEALVRRYQGRVYSVAWHYLRDREEARDAAQETFVKIYRGLDSLRAGAPFLPWMLRVARNCSIDRLRRLKARTTASEVPLDDAPPIAASGRSPEERWQESGRRGVLYRALSTLSEKNREMILLKEIQQLKLEEIATLLEVPLGTVKTRSHRARLELARAVKGLDPSFGA